MSSELREEFLRLLREDVEFRYAVLGLLGIEEVLKSISRNTEAIKDLQQQVRDLQLQVRDLQQQVKVLQGQVAELQREVREHTRAIRDLQQQVVEHSRAIRDLQQQVKSLQGQALELQKVVKVHTEELRRLSDRITALGARWGVLAEEAFREGMRGVVERILGVAKIERWCYVDKEGFVYGYPAVIDVDLVVKDGEHILIEVKSSVDRGDVLELKRISELYERVTGVKPRLVIVTPYARDRAIELAKLLNIEVYTAP